MDLRCDKHQAIYKWLLLSFRWSRWSASKKSMSMRLTGRFPQTWTWTGPILHQREASSTACSEERQVLVLRLLSEGVGAKVLPLFLPSFLAPLLLGLVQSQHGQALLPNPRELLEILRWCEQTTPLSPVVVKWRVQGRQNKAALSFFSSSQDWKFRSLVVGFFSLFSRSCFLVSLCQRVKHGLSLAVNF